jgi:hypothetical protein
MKDIVTNFYDKNNNKIGKKLEKNQIYKITEEELLVKIKS